MPLFRFASADGHETVGATVSTLVVTVAVLVLPTASVAAIVYVVLPDGAMIGPVTRISPLPGNLVGERGQARLCVGHGAGPSAWCLRSSTRCPNVVR